MTPAQELLISYDRLLKIKSIPYGYKSNWEFKREVMAKILYIKKKEKIK